jgi:hypothetical protein
MDKREVEHEAIDVLEADLRREIESRIENAAVRQRYWDHAAAIFERARIKIDRR